MEGKLPEPEPAVIDRIVEGVAVVLVGEDEEEFQVPESGLPEGAEEGSLLLVRRTLDILELNDGEDRRQEFRARLDDLRRKRGGGRFGSQ